uniref:Abi family protein n=1 Tax=Acinetobacter gerneri TaxID=202952 RepID=UPI00293BD2AB|nr:Abi family protein [Acinetobacter gerneri]WNL65217.1 hypothetical protein GPGIFMOB_00168 [Acinetobacter gerneri]
MTKTFSKDPKTYPELLQKLKSDGLKITDQTAALRHLKQISYYRLKGYGLAFRQYDETGKRLSTYQPNVELVTLIHMSMIDAELRSLIFSGNRPY